MSCSAFLCFLSLMPIRQKDVYKRQLIALASDKDEDLYKATQKDQISYAVTYGEFMYQAGSWKYPCLLYTSRCV